jgi:SAM-dependent methyltransferase
MLLARREVLARGYYDPIARAVADAVAAAGPAGCVVDAGCGDGFYLGQVERHLAYERAKGPILIGIDVAKDAARIAGRMYPEAAFVMGDIWAHLPLREACADVVLSIFAPRNVAEFARITHPGSELLVVIPTDEHLAGLRAQVALLRVQADKREHVVERLSDAFSLATVLPVRYEITLDPADAAQVVRMSPTVRHVPETEIAVLAARQAPVATPVGVELLTFRRNA